MKKLFMLLVLVLAALTISSCDGEKQFGFIYSLQSEGISDGFVDMTFITGNFNVKGEAEYVFSLTNDTPTKLDESPAVDLEEALESKDEKLLKSANETNDWIDNAIKINAYEGTYDIHIKGYVIETLTGIKFEIDKRFTNAVDEFELE